jgi:uncharacterized protein
MHARLPKTINPWQLANTSGQLNGQLALAEMPRLTSLLLNTDGLVDVTLQGGVDNQGIRFITGRLQTCVQLLCQRCLQPLSLLLCAEINLGLVLSESQINNLPKQYEPLLTEEELTLLELVEDELILALPIVPKHSQEDNCQPQIQNQAADQAADTKTETDPDNPFAVLSTLLKDE